MLREEPLDYAQAAVRDPAARAARRAETLPHFKLLYFTFLNAMK